MYGKNPSKIFSETKRLISMKLCVKHRWLKYYNVYISHGPVMTLTQFMARSTWVAHAFEWGKLFKCHMKGKASWKLANGQNIDYSEKRLHLPLHCSPLAISITWKMVPHEILLWIPVHWAMLVLKLHDANLASLSVLKNSRWSP